VSLDVTPYPPQRGTTSVITLTGTAQVAMTLDEWDINFFINGQNSNQYTQSLSSYAPVPANGQVTITYNYNPGTSPSGYYDMKLLLSTTQGYYVNCWSVNYYLV
jgi:hypothetical protein